jgi:hypothetical protein
MGVHQQGWQHSVWGLLGHKGDELQSQGTQVMLHMPKQQPWRQLQVQPEAGQAVPFEWTWEAPVSSVLVQIQQEQQGFTTPAPHSPPATGTSFLLLLQHLVGGLCMSLQLQQSTAQLVTLLLRLLHLAAVVSLHRTAIPLLLGQGCWDELGHGRVFLQGMWHQLLWVPEWDCSQHRQLLPACRTTSSSSSSLLPLGRQVTAGAFREQWVPKGWWLGRTVAREMWSPRTPSMQLLRPAPGHHHQQQQQQQQQHHGLHGVSMRLSLLSQSLLVPSLLQKCPQWERHSLQQQALLRLAVRFGLPAALGQQAAAAAAAGVTPLLPCLLCPAC